MWSLTHAPAPTPSFPGCVPEAALLLQVAVTPFFLPLLVVGGISNCISPASLLAFHFLGSIPEATYMLQVTVIPFLLPTLAVGGLSSWEAFEKVTLLHVAATPSPLLVGGAHQ